MKTTLVRKILSATDFSESALKAQDYAVFLAQAYEAKLQVVSCVGKAALVQT